jgi:hypothetical protein
MGLATVFGPRYQFRFGGGGGGYRPYFENYTVDASILKMQTK